MTASLSALFAQQALAGITYWNKISHTSTRTSWYKNIYHDNVAPVISDSILKITIYSVSTQLFTRPSPKRQKASAQWRTDFCTRLMIPKTKRVCLGGRKYEIVWYYNNNHTLPIEWLLLLLAERIEQLPRSALVNTYDTNLMDEPKSNPQNSLSKYMCLHCLICCCQIRLGYIACGCTRYTRINQKYF